MITSGDVLLRFARDLPPFPAVDVLGLGMRLPPERAKDFGVFFTRATGPASWRFFYRSRRRGGFGSWRRITSGWWTRECGC
jgi:hypothetical protein